MVRFPVTASAAALFFAVQPALAQDPQEADSSLAAAIELAPGATCIDKDRLVAQAQTWLGRSRVPAGVRIHVRGDPHDPQALAFRIVLQGRTRERRFDRLPVSCDEANAVVGLAISLAIDASALRDIVGPPEGSTPPRRFFAAQLAAGVDVVPGTSLGASVGLEYGVAEWLSVRGDLLGHVSWNNTIQGSAGAFDAVVLAASPQACAGGAIAEHFRLELCSGAALGVLHAQGHGYATSRSATGAWFVASGGLRLVASTGIPWALDIGAVFPLRVPSIRADTGGASVYRDPDPQGAMVAAGPVVIF